jgi:hypothetical protein
LHRNILNIFFQRLTLDFLSLKSELEISPLRGAYQKAAGRRYISVALHMYLIKRAVRGARTKRTHRPERRGILSARCVKMFGALPNVMGDRTR